MSEITEIDNLMDELKIKREEILENCCENVQAYYKIEDFIQENCFTHSMKEVFVGYEHSLNNERLTCSTERIIMRRMKEIKRLYNEGYVE